MTICCPYDYYYSHVVLVSNRNIERMSGMNLTNAIFHILIMVIETVCSIDRMFVIITGNWLTLFILSDNRYFFIPQMVLLFLVQSNLICFLLFFRRVILYGISFLRVIPLSSKTCNNTSRLKSGEHSLSVSSEKKNELPVLHTFLGGFSP